MIMKAIIIGYGKLGSHLHHALKKAGKVKSFTIIRSRKATLSPAAVKNSDIIFITTQDSKIKNAVKLLAQKQFELGGKFIYHTSGSLTSDELSPLAAKGAYTASLHPVQTFESPVKKDEGRFRGIYIAIEGAPAAVKKAAVLARSMKAHTLNLAKEDKVYHHICCVIASNFVTTLISQIEQVGKVMKLDSKAAGRGITGGQKNGFNNHTFFNIYKPLASQTIENIAMRGAVKSLTGPFERNDLDTIIKHLGALGGELLPIYILMGIETVKLSLEKKSIKLKDASQILKTFDKSLKTNKIG